MIEFGKGHAVDNGIERHTGALVHKEIPQALRLPVPGLDKTVGKGGVMQHAWRRDGKVCVDELESTDFLVVVPAELDQNARGKSGDGLVPIWTDTFN